MTTRLGERRRQSRTLPRHPRSAATARRLVRSACTEWGLGELAEDGALIVSELVANAVQHARRESIRVAVEQTEPCAVRLAVSDFTKAPPVPRTPAHADEGGRGLPLVAALAASWGTERHRWGKTVWAVLR